MTTLGKERMDSQSTQYLTACPSINTEKTRRKKQPIKAA